MKKLLLAIMALAFVCCIRQTVHTGSTYLDSYTFEEVWAASIRAVNDIGFTIDSVDREAGFIAAESGTHIGQDVPPRFSIMIANSGGKVYVDCKVLQKEQFVDVFGHGKRTIRNFMEALNMNLRRGNY